MPQGGDAAIEGRALEGDAGGKASPDSSTAPANPSRRLEEGTGGKRSAHVTRRQLPTLVAVRGKRRLGGVPNSADGFPMRSPTTNAARQANGGESPVGATSRAEKLVPPASPILAAPQTPDHPPPPDSPARDPPENGEGESDDDVSSTGPAAANAAALPPSKTPPDVGVAANVLGGDGGGGFAQPEESKMKGRGKDPLSVEPSSTRTGAAAADVDAGGARRAEGRRETNGDSTRSASCVEPTTQQPAKPRPPAAQPPPPRPAQPPPPKPRLPAPRTHVPKPSPTPSAPPPSSTAAALPTFMPTASPASLRGASPRSLSPSPKVNDASSKPAFKPTASPASLRGAAPPASFTGTTGTESSTAKARGQQTFTRTSSPATVRATAASATGNAGAAPDLAGGDGAVGTVRDEQASAVGKVDYCKTVISVVKDVRCEALVSLCTTL